MVELLKWLPLIITIVAIIVSWTTMGITIKSQGIRLDLLEKDFKEHCLISATVNSSIQVTLTEIRKDIFYIKEQSARDMQYIKERLSEKRI